MKRLTSLLLVISIVFFCCSGFSAEIPSIDGIDFTGLNDPSLLPYIEDTLYSELVETLNSEEYFVENVNAIYISQEYLDEIAYNSQANVFFGYTLAELESVFQGEKYVFTLGADGTTTVEAFEKYDDTYDKVIRNIAVGTGVILICVTVSTVATGLPAISLIFAAAAKTGAAGALSGAVLGGVSAGVVTAMQTGNVSESLKSAAVAGSEAFKWGAIIGAISGGASEAIALKGATLKGLNMNEAALIQKESGYPLDVIKNFSSMEQYNICKEAGLVPQMINGKLALIRKIDLNYIDEFGRTNLQRMQQGLAALDPSTGQAYELHHIGQEMNSTLAILTKAEHMQGGNNLIWHVFGGESQINRNMFDMQRANFWKTTASLFLEGGI